MKYFSIGCALLLSGFSFSQTTRLKKKYLKTYEGQIPAYSINTGSSLKQVAAVKIELALTKDSMYVTVGKARFAGTYVSTKEIKNEYQLIGTMEQSGIKEVFQFSAKTGELTRKGIFPQPDAVLKPKQD